MSEDEYNAFAIKLKNDSALQEKVHSVRLLFLGISESAMEGGVKEFHKELTADAQQNTPKTGKIFSMKQWLVAASIIIIAGIGALLFLNRNNREEKLFATYYKPDPGLITAMSVSDNYEFDRAMIDYKTKDYDGAIHAWEKLLTAKPDNDTLNYFIASAWLAKKNNEKAIIYFQKVISDTSSYFLHDAYWYAGLALLKEGKDKEAIPFIEKSEHPHKNDLIEKLEK
jgi:tetratricopeptide (TPR) repeat protein